MYTSHSNISMSLIIYSDFEKIVIFGDKNSVLKENENINILFYPSF